jgi:hypothetical protein
MDRLHSYPKVLALGHPALRLMFLCDDLIVVQEKVDGSQFTFGVCDDGLLHCRSKGVEIILDAPGMFDLAVVTARRLFLEHKLIPGEQYRCEYLRKPKHNTLAYGRAPLGNLVLFDIEKAPNNFVISDDFLADRARYLGIDKAPCLWHGTPNKLEAGKTLEALLTTESFLGGGKVEGIVIKNRGRFGPDGKMLCAKLVRPEFKEQHAISWREQNPTGKDIREEIAQSLRTDARWEKAIQHLTETGNLTGTPTDIGLLLKEINLDIEGEAAEACKAMLWKWARQHILRRATAGFPEWYKRRIGIVVPTSETKE